MAQSPPNLKPLPPFAMCTGSPRLGLLRPPRSDRSTVDPAPSAALDGRDEARTETVPTFAVNRSTKEEPDFAPAASPRLPRSTSPWPPCGKCEPAQEFPDQRDGQERTAPGPHPSGSSRSVIKGRMTPVPRVLLSVIAPRTRTI